MGKAFELGHEIEVGATPEQAWQAVATGEGMDAEFMGRNEIEPREGGKIRTVTPEWSEEATITTWDPPNRFTYRTRRPKTAPSCPSTTASRGETRATPRSSGRTRRGHGGISEAMSFALA